jgi:Tfp pilus assembly protein PilO
MSEPTPIRKSSLNRISSSVQRLSVIREQRFLGPAELIALGCSGLMLLLVVVSYFYFLLPARSRLDGLRSERSRLNDQVSVSRELAVQGETTEATTQRITQSLDDFESNHLLSADRGRMGLYDNLNVLIRKNALRNTSGPTYTPLEPTDSKAGTPGTRSTNTRFQSTYPGIAISVTVEGQYQNLRRFIRDLETTKQFIIINSVELERSTETNNAPVVVEGDSGNTPRSALVSLRLELTTYFQRASVANEVNNGAH